MTRMSSHCVAWPLTHAFLFMLTSVATSELIIEKLGPGISNKEKGKIIIYSYLSFFKVYYLFLVATLQIQVSFNLSVCLSVVIFSTFIAYECLKLLTKIRPTNEHLFFYHYASCGQTRNCCFSLPKVGSSCIIT